MGTVAALAATGAMASDNGSSDYEGPSEEQLRLEEAQREIAQAQREVAALEKAAAELRAKEAEIARKQAEKEAWLKMTPDEREAITIKKMWIAPCKEWSCLN